MADLHSGGCDRQKQEVGAPLQDLERFTFLAGAKLQGVWESDLQRAPRKDPGTILALTCPDVSKRVLTHS